MYILLKKQNKGPFIQTIILFCFTYDFTIKLSDGSMRVVETKGAEKAPALEEAPLTDEPSATDSEEDMSW